MTPQEIASLAQLQRRAAVEDRAHLVALVEFAWQLPPANAERLIPGSTRGRDSTRLDCEKPIRDENGKFLGCEAGGGSEGGGSAVGGGSGGSSPPASASSGGDHDVKRAEKLKRQQAEIDRHAASGDKSEEAKKILYLRASAIEGDQDPDEAERRYRNRPLAPSPDDSPRVAKAKADREEARKINRKLTPEQHDAEDARALAQANAIDDAVARKLVKEPSGAAGAKEIAGARRSAIGYDELRKQHEVATQALTDLRNLNSPDDGDEKLAIDPDELDFEGAIEQVSGAAGIEHQALNVREETDGYEAPTPPDPDEEPDEDSFGSPDDYKAAKAEYDKAAKDYPKAKAAHDKLVRRKAAEAADALEKTHELQLATIEKMKAAKKEATAKLKALKKEGGDPEKLVDAKLRKAAEKAQEDLDGDGEMTDDEVAAAEKIVADYDQATEAAEQLSSDHEEAIDDVSDTSTYEDALESLKEKAKETKAAAAKLRKGLGQEPKAIKAKPAKKSPAKRASAKADPDDEEEDADEDDEDDADEE